MSFRFTRLILLILSFVRAQLFIATLVWGNEGAFSGLIVFGDSLSDQGNYYNLSGDNKIESPYFEGRATNGEVWVELLAKYQGLPELRPSFHGGSNFAYIGARTGWFDANSGDDFRIDIGDQIDNFISSVQDRMSGEELVVIWGGGNDFLNADPKNIISNLVKHIESLVNVGAKHFLIPNLPPLGNLPALDYELNVRIRERVEGLIKDKVESRVYKFLEKNLESDVADFTKLILPSVEQYFGSLWNYFPQMANLFLNDFTNGKITLQDVKSSGRTALNFAALFVNEYLLQELRNLEEKLGVKIYYLDIYKAFNRIKEHELLIIEDRVVHPETGDLHPDGEQFLFFDAIHPTKKGHQIIAKEAMKVLGKD